MNLFHYTTSYFEAKWYRCYVAYVIQITLDTYSYVSLGLQDASVSYFDKAFGNQYNKQAVEAIQIH